MSTLLSDLDSRGLTPDLEPYCLPSGNVTTSDMPPGVVKMMEIGHTVVKSGGIQRATKFFSQAIHAAPSSAEGISCA